MQYSTAHTITNEVQSPWLSIVIPIYNAEKYLSKCLDSIHSQVFQNFEVIMVDDGSLDTSPNICLDYASKDPRFIYLKKENGGPYQTRVYGAERASGTYITFCDADDYYANNNAFSVIYNELSAGCYSAMQFGYYKKYNHLKLKLSAVKKSISHNQDSFFATEYPQFLCNLWHCSHVTTSVWNKVYHRTLLQNFPHSDSAERVFWGEDLVVNLQLLSTCESFRIIPDALYGYRELSGGTNRFSKRTMNDLNTIKKHQLLHLERYIGEQKTIIENALYAEVAAWFFLYIQDALNYLSDSELAEQINDTLQLPSFLAAREYYTNVNQENWDAVNLLRKADATAYITKAKELRASKKVTFKKNFMNLLKKIYTSI